MAVDAESLIIRLEAQSEQLRREMRRAQQSVNTGSKRMERDLRRIDMAGQRLNQTFMSLRRGLGFLGAGLSVQGLRSVATGALNTADALSNAADRVAVSVETLQEYSYAAEQVGVNTNTLYTALQRFTRRLGEAAQGQGTLNATLQQYGVEIFDVNGRLRSSEEVFRDFADAVKNADNDAERLRMTVSALDSEGAPLVNMLRRGSEGLSQMGREAHELGRVMGEETVDAASRLNTEINTFFQTIRTQINEGLLEVLTSDLDDLSDVAKDKEFQEGLRFLGGMIGAIGLAAKEATADVGRFVDIFRDPSWGTLATFFTEGTVIGLARRTLQGFGVGGPQSPEQAMARLIDLNQQLAEARDELLRDPDRPGLLEHIRQLEAELGGLQALFDPASDQPVVTLDPIRVDGAPLGGAGITTGGSTVDVQAQAALAAMQHATMLREQHALSVAEMLNGLRQEAQMNELTLQHMHDQSGELELQQRLLEIRNQLGAEAAGQAEPVLRHIQEQTLAIGRQQSAYDTLNASAERAFDRIGGAMTRMFMEGEDAAITWHNTVNAILSEIMQTMMQLAVINPLKNALFGGNAATMSDMGGLLGSLFHSGGIVGAPTATRLVSPLAFAGAPRMHSGGIAGDEVPAILQRGEEVLPENHPRHRKNAGSGDVHVNLKVINNAGVNVSAGRARSDGQGGVSLEVALDEAVARQLGRFGSSSNKAIRTAFGAKPALVSR